MSVYKESVSLRSKLVFFFLIPVVAAVAILGIYSYYHSRDALLHRTYSQLIALREARAEQVRQFYDSPAVTDSVKPEYDEFKELSNIMLISSPVQGMGLSGESYLIDDSMRLRSASRFEDIVSPKMIATEGVENALKGESGTGIYPDYRNIMVIGAYAPVRLNGRMGVLVVEIDYDEAMVPIVKTARNLLLISLLVLFLMSFLVWFFSRSLSKPLMDLSAAVRKVGSGDFEVEVPSRSTDEIGRLSHAFNEMSERLRSMSAEVVMQRRQRFSAFVDGQEQERQRLSRELHDGLGQLLISLKLRLEALQPDISEEVSDALDQVKAGIDRAIDDVRNISGNLIPHGLREFGLISTLRIMCKDIVQNDSFAISFESYGTDNNLNTRIMTYLYRIAQEAISNAIRHSGSSDIRLSISSTPHAVSLVIQDKGKGFIFAEVKPERGNGLYNMRERVRVLGGEFRVVSTPQEGTRVWAYIPLNREQIM